MKPQDECQRASERTPSTTAARAALWAIAIMLGSFPCSALALDHGVLFVGNSYTSANQLDVVYGKLVAEGMPAWNDVFIARYTKGGYRLSQHAVDATNNSQLDTYLHGGSPQHAWDAVVLQDQSQIPSFPPNNGDYLASRAGAVTLATSIDAIGAKTMLFLTWGRRDSDAGNMQLNPDFLTMQQNLKTGYEGYQQAIVTAGHSADIVPVGLAWKRIYQQVKDGGAEPTEGDTLFTRLYAGDGSHPSAHGTYLTACTMYAALTNQSPIGLTWAPAGLPAVDRDALQTAAADTVLGGSGAGGGSATSSSGASGGATATASGGGAITTVSSHSAGGGKVGATSSGSGPAAIDHQGCSCYLGTTDSSTGWWMFALACGLVRRRAKPRRP